MPQAAGENVWTLIQLSIARGGTVGVRGQCDVVLAGGVLTLQDGVARGDFTLRRGVARHLDAQRIGVGGGREVGAVDSLALVGERPGDIPGIFLGGLPERIVVVLVVDAQEALVGGDDPLLQGELVVWLLTTGGVLIDRGRPPRVGRRGDQRGDGLEAGGDARRHVREVDRERRDVVVLGQHDQIDRRD